MLFVQLMRAAASRTFCTAGSNRPMRMAMMAITTSSSISVNPGRDRRGGRMGHLGEERMRDEGTHVQTKDAPSSIAQINTAGGFDLANSGPDGRGRPLTQAPHTSR